MFYNYRFFLFFFKRINVTLGRMFFLEMANKHYILICMEFINPFNFFIFILNLYLSTKFPQESNPIYIFYFCAVSLQDMSVQGYATTQASRYYISISTENALKS